MNATTHRRFDPALITQKLRGRNACQLLATVHEYEVLADGKAARIIVGLSSNNSDKKTVQAAINKALKGSARLVEGSFRQLSGVRSSHPLLTGFVLPNRVVEPYTTSRIENMRVLSSNILMDETDQTLWNIKESGGQQFLCRDQDENLSELLSSVRERKVGVPMIQTLSRTTELSKVFVPCGKKDYLEFVDTEEACIKFGMVVSSCTDTGDILVCVRDGEETRVDQALVVEVASLGDSLPKLKKEVADELKPTTVEEPLDLTEQDIKQYYADLYQQDPSYFANLETLMQTHGIA